MNWTDEAYAEAERRDSADTDWYALSAESLLAEGAAWQRDQLRTDEAVERVAESMWAERAKGTAHPNYPWAGITEQLRDDLRKSARAAIDALLGEES